MTKTKYLLLLDRSGENNPEMLIMLRVAGYRVECFSDDLIAVNKYRLMFETERPFDLVLVVEGSYGAYLEMEQLVECFGRLVLFNKESAKISLFNSSGESLLGSHLENLIAIVAEEMCGDKNRVSIGSSGL